MWETIKAILLGVFIILLCVIGVIGGLVWAVNSSNERMDEKERIQAEEEKQIFLECYKKTHDAGWCYSL